MRIDVRTHRRLAPEDIDEWTRLARRVHPPAEVRLGAELRWADVEPDDRFVRLWDESDLRACAWVTTRTIDVAGRDVRVAGIRGVMTDREYRRRGYGRAVMERAHELIDSCADCEFALLFSSVMAVPFYEALGWRAISGPVFCDQPDGRIDYTQRLAMAPVMVRTRDPSGALPRAPIDVRGFPW